MPPGSGRSESSSVRCPEERPERRNATSGAPGDARAGHTARGTSKKVPDEDRSAFRRSAPLTHVREKGNEGAARADQTIGTMTHVYLSANRERQSLKAGPRPRGPAQSPAPIGRA